MCHFFVPHCSILHSQDNGLRCQKTKTKTKTQPTKSSFAAFWRDYRHQNWVLYCFFSVNIEQYLISETVDVKEERNLRFSPDYLPSFLITIISSWSLQYMTGILKGEGEQNPVMASGTVLQILSNCPLIFCNTFLSLIHI